MLFIGNLRIKDFFFECYEVVDNFYFFVDDVKNWVGDFFDYV